MKRLHAILAVVVLAFASCEDDGTPELETGISNHDHDNGAGRDVPGNQDPGVADPGSLEIDEVRPDSNDAPRDSVADDPGCEPCGDIVGIVQRGCVTLRCEDGCLINGFAALESRCAQADRCLRRCDTGDSSSDCGICRCMDAEGNGCRDVQCVSADPGCREEEFGQGDGCCSSNPCGTSQCRLFQSASGIVTHAECVEGASRPDGELCAQQDRCLVDTRCSEGQCVGPRVQCDDANPCTTDDCDPATGDCIFPAAMGAPCDDGQGCTENDTCTDNGACTGISRDCDDRDPCTADRCDPLTGACVHEPQTGLPCDDGNPCSVDDACVAGTCAGAPFPCEAIAECLEVTPIALNGQCECRTTTRPGWCHVPGEDGQCLADGAVDSTGCFRCDAKHSATPTFLHLARCDDGDPCTIADTCSSTALRCQGTTVQVDPAPLWCEVPVCNGVNAVVSPHPIPGYCVVDRRCIPVGTAVDQCRRCVEGGPGLPGQVVVVNATTPCDDGNPCTNGDACDNFGFCRSGTPYTCPQVAGGCAVSTCAGDGSCNDPLWIPTSRQCLIRDPNGWSCVAAGQSLPGLPCMVCDPAVDPFRMTAAPATTACASADCCLDAGMCDGRGNCIQSQPADCDDGNDCTIDLCLTGLCDSSGKPACRHEPTASLGPCTDPCGQSGSCVLGVCLAVAPCIDPAIRCDDDDACTVDSHDDIAGICVHSARDCDDGDSCTIDSCNATTGECTHEPATGNPCDDGDACTEADACVAGMCLGVHKECVQPDTPCRYAACDPEAGDCRVFDSPNLAACNDDNPCTPLDVCDAGVCVGAGACEWSVGLDESSAMQADGLRLQTNVFTWSANVRFDPGTGVTTLRTLLSLVGRDDDGRAHGVEWLVGGDSAPSQGYCAAAGRLLLRVWVHGKPTLISYRESVKVPADQWTQVVVSRDEAGVIFRIGGSSMSQAIRCDNGQSPESLAWPNLESVSLVIGSAPRPDGTQSAGVPMTLTDLTLWDLALPLGPPTYAQPNLYCLWVDDTDFDFDARPLAAYRFNEVDGIVAIDESGNGFDAQFGTATAGAPRRITVPEAFRKECPGIP